MIGVKERAVTFRVNGEEVMFEAKFTPHYPKDMVGCFIVQVFNKAKEKAKEVELRSMNLPLPLMIKLYMISLAFEIVRKWKIMAKRRA